MATIKVLSISASGEQQEILAPSIASVMLLDGSQAMTASINLGGFAGINGATPANPTDLVIKSYADALTGGFAPFFLLGT